MDPPTGLTLDEERNWRNRCWFKAAISDDDHLVHVYMRLCMWLHEKGGYMSSRLLRRVQLWLEVIKDNFRLRGMRVTVNVSTVIMLKPPTSIELSRSISLN